MDKITPPTGKCFICHKSTKLMIHAPCIKKAALLHTGMSDKSKRSTRKRYAAGYVPYFAKL